MVLSIFLIVLSYLLGSLPFGYLLTRFSTGKNILEIGWRKTSGSNVFKNVGKWQGILTGVLDVSKGFFAVFLAQNFGLSPFFQVLCGLSAVTGHNWSIFLKLAPLEKPARAPSIIGKIGNFLTGFAGGRGIGTFIGAFLALSPKILGLAVIPLFLLALIWDASLATILFLITAIILSFYFHQFGTAGLFSLIALVPIFVKRLSPMKELSLKKPRQIRNRLIFDDDEAKLDLRIKRIIKRLTTP